MNNSNGYIYIRSHPSYNINNVYKIGKTMNIPERDMQYATGELIRGNFEEVFEIINCNIDSIEKSLQKNFSSLNIKYNAGIEFYDKSIISFIEPYFINNDIKYKKLTHEEINNLVRCNRERNFNEEYIWNEREYQKDIIKFSLNRLSEENKIYIELPTGGGKSYIVYNLFEYINSDFIIITSPRKIINTQNILQKYLQILSSNYIIYNYSSDTNFDNFLRLSNKKILICCTQSINKIYEKILSYNITNITIWFDEAHWSIEDKCNNLNKNNSFWLLNNTIIKYRIFTSASPNKLIVEKNEKIFGLLYSPINVKELIELKWLCKIKLLVYSENKVNINSIKYIIDDFTEKKRKYGFSFHNKQKNAFNLFHNHYIQYKNNDTDIKPFLLISNTFNYDKEIILNYDYTNINSFENNVNSIGYVVAKYNIGYDFYKLDFIFFSDPKLSIQDIKQCIGRGIRSDELDLNGSNKEKELIISLPIYVDEENEKTKYEKIIEVLLYLLHEVKIIFEDIEFKNRYKSNIAIEINKNVKCSETDNVKYSGTDNVKSIILNLLDFKNKTVSLSMTYEQAKKILACKNIKNKKTYYDICNADNRFSNEPDILFKNKFVNWIDYLSIEKIFYNLETCKIKINEYLNNNIYFKNKYLEFSTIVNKLCELDSLFPPNDLWLEYYDMKSLKNILTIDTKKKKIGIFI